MSRPYRTCSYCGAPCRGWTCGACSDLPRLDVDGRRVVESRAMPGNAPEVAHPANGKAA